MFLPQFSCGLQLFGFHKLFSGYFASKSFVLIIFLRLLLQIDKESLARRTDSLSEGNKKTLGSKWQRPTL